MCATVLMVYIPLCEAVIHICHAVYTNIVMCFPGNQLYCVTAIHCKNSKIIIPMLSYVINISICVHV